MLEKTLKYIQTCLYKHCDKICSGGYLSVSNAFISKLNEKFRVIWPITYIKKIIRPVAGFITPYSTLLDEDRSSILQGSRWALTVLKVTSPSRKIREKWQLHREKLYTQNYCIFCQFRSKLAITHTTVFKWKEKYDAVVVDCHHSLRCVVNEWKWVSLKVRLPLLLGSHFSVSSATILP